MVEETVVEVEFVPTNSVVGVVNGVVFNVVEEVVDEVGDEILDEVLDGVLDEVLVDVVDEVVGSKPSSIFDLRRPFGFIWTFLFRESALRFM